MKSSSYFFIKNLTFEEYSLFATHLNTQSRAIRKYMYTSTRELSSTRPILVVSTALTAQIHEQNAWLDNDNEMK